MNFQNKKKEKKTKKWFYYFLEPGRRGNLQLQHIFFAIPPRELLLDREGWHNRPFAVHKGLDSCSMLQHCCVSSAPSPKRNLSQLPRSWNVWTRLAVVSQKQQGPTRHSREDCDGRVDAFVNTTAIGWCSFAVRWCDLAPARKRAPPGSSEVIIPQQRKLIGSSAQSGSAVHWCRRRVRFNKVSRRFRRLRWRFGRLWCRARSGSTGFRRRFRTKKIREALVQSQVRFNRVPRRFWRRFGRLWCRARSCSPGFWRRFWRRFRGALVQSEVRFNSVLEKVPEKVWKALV